MEMLGTRPSPAVGRTFTDAPKNAIASRLEGITEQHGQIIMRLAQVYTALVNKRDRSLGSFPEKAQGETARPSPNGAVNRLGQQVDDLGQLTAMLESVTHEIEGI